MVVFLGISITFVLFVIVLSTFGGNSVTCSRNVYEQNIAFKFFRNNALVFESNSSTDDLTRVCNPSEPWLIVVPGWTDNCTEATAWVPKVIESMPELEFTKYRGGCICCMDFYAFSKDTSLIGYVNLTTHFDGISKVLTNKLEQFERQNFKPEKGHMFSMSYGSRVAINSGRDFGGRLGGIDACDPAGPLFYPNPLMQARGSARLAARNVQIIHTSVDEGTFERDGHQDWMMGECGINQEADPPNKSAETLYSVISGMVPFYMPISRDNHSTCPWLYISAFENVFPAIRNECCPRSDRDDFPNNFRMGYMQLNKGRVQNKTLFARTYKRPPYNVPN